MSDIEIGSVWHDEIGGDYVKVLRVDSADVDRRCVWFQYESNCESLLSLHRFTEKFTKVFTVEQPESQGRKDDSAKRRYSLLPKGTVNSVVDVLEFGSKKYADNNWQKVPNAKNRYYDAALRHIDAWFSGEIKDSETGLPHLAHAICCLMFLMWFDGE